MRNRYLLMLMLLASVCAKAQDTLQGYRNDFKLSLIPTALTATPYISYERTFAKGFALEVDAYYHDADAKWAVNEDMFGTQVAAKYLLAVRLDEWWSMGLIPWIVEIHKHGGIIPTIRDMNHRNHVRRQKKREGLLVSGTYLKTGITYQHKWRTFDCFAGNQGSTIFTEDRTGTGEQFGLNFIIGNQTVADCGFIFDIYCGCHVPVTEMGIGQSLYSPAYYFYLTAGMKLGWAF
ncbi:MAG: hypothetical protein KBT28_00760 [Bacteroidales bacterium]|nr:hypothetical protein [Candidatus Colimorpha merdihippi]